MTFVNITKDVYLDIDEDFDSHKDSLQKYTNASCNSYEPLLELTDTNKHGTNRYIKLRYNKSKQLQSIFYWDVNPEYNMKDCYFTQKSISLGDKYTYVRSFWSRMFKDVNEVEL